MPSHVRSSLAACAALALGCGGYSSSSYMAPAPPQQPAGPVITISANAYSPLNLHAKAGATVTVVNRDGSVLHSVTSEASPNDFTPGAPSGLAPFDTGPFTGSMTFVLPANAAAGTVIPYYCTVHLTMMATPNGSITIDPNAVSTTAAPSTPAPMGGGGGY
jgi:plastocyanin